MAQAVTRALQTIRRDDACPEQIDHAILAAINVTFACSGGVTTSPRASTATSP